MALIVLSPLYSASANTTKGSGIIQGTRLLSLAIAGG